VSRAGSRGWLSRSVSWRLVFRVLLAAMLVSTGIGLWYATAHRPDFQAAFPGAEHTAVYGALLLTGAAGVVAICGLLLWQRWAVPVYFVVAVAGLALDAAARAPLAHQVTVLVGALAVAWLVYANRERFRPDPSSRPGS